MRQFRFDPSPIQGEALQLATVELRETPENVAKGLEELRILLRNDCSLRCRDDDSTLTVFLRPCKWYPKSAYDLMRRMADFKEKHRNLLESLMPEDEKRPFVEEKIINVLIEKDQNGRRLVLLNCGALWDPSRVPADQVFRIFYLLQLAALLEPETQVRGFVVILNFEGLGMKQIRGLSPSFSMKLLSFIQEALPLRLKEVHIIRQPFVFKMVWTLFKPFLREKLANRLFFHGFKMSSLHKYLDPAFLPEDFDGKLPRIDYNGREWWPCIEGHEEHFRQWCQFGYCKQPSQP